MDDAERRRRRGGGKVEKGERKYIIILQSRYPSCIHPYLPSSMIGTYIGNKVEGIIRESST